MNEKENSDNYLGGMETDGGVSVGQGAAREISLLLVLAIGLLSALISLMPHIVAELSPGRNFEGLSGLDSVVMLLFYPGVIFGIALSLVYKSASTTAVSILTAILASALGYFFAFILGYFFSIFLTVFGGFAVAGFVGGSVAAKGMRSLVRLKSGAGVKIGLFGGVLGVVAAGPFGEYLRSDSFEPDFLNSWESFALLFFIWQVGMILIMFFYTVKQTQS